MKLGGGGEGWPSVCSPEEESHDAALVTGQVAMVVTSLPGRESRQSTPPFALLAEWQPSSVMQSSARVLAQQLGRLGPCE